MQLGPTASTEMQGKTDYIPKNFFIRAYQLNSY